MKNGFLQSFAALSIAAIGSSAYAQDQAPETSSILELGFKSTLRSNDNFEFVANPSGSTTIWDNELSVRFLNSTPISKLDFAAEGDLRLLKASGQSSEFDLDEPDLSLDYMRDGSRARFGASASFNRDRLTFIDPTRLLEDAEDTDLVTDSGTREARGVSFTFEDDDIGRFGLQVALSHNSVGYKNTTDTRLFDSETNSGSVTLLAALATNLTARVGYSTVEYDADDAVQSFRKTDRYTLGAVYEIDEIWSVDAALNRTTILDEDRAVATRTESSRVGGSLMVKRDFPDGSFNAKLESGFSVTGRRNTLSFGRNIEAANGSLNAMIGATRGPSGDTNIVGNFDYQRPFRLGLVSLTAGRSFGTSNAGNDFGTTRVNFQYQRELTDLVGLSLGLGYTKVEDDGSGAVEEANSRNITAALAFLLTEEWGGQFGVTHRSRSTGADPTLESNEIFLTIGRKFRFER